MLEELLELIKEYQEEMVFTEKNETKYGTAILRRTVPVIRTKHLIKFIKQHQEDLIKNDDDGIRQKNPKDFILRKNV